MFDQLFGSKTRVKLLSLFLNNPERPYYVREITRKIDEQINSVRRELGNLLSIGIVKSDSANNKLYYEANPKYEHYKELRSIFASIPITTKALKDTREDDQIADKLQQTGQIELAFLTGTFVRDPHSSVDLCVIGDVNRAKVAKVVADLEQEMGRELNYTVMTPEEYRYRKDLKDRFLTSIIEAKKIVLIDGQQSSRSRAQFDPEQPERELDEGEQVVKIKPVEKPTVKE